MTVADVLLAVVLLVHAGVLGVLAVNLLAFARDRRRPLPTDLPSVSVLVPARNEEDTLRLLLPTLLAQRGVDAQIVVVDDASEDGTWDVLQAHADPRLLPVRGDAGLVALALEVVLEGLGQVAFVFDDQERGVGGDDAVAPAQRHDLVDELVVFPVQTDLIQQESDLAGGPQPWQKLRSPPPRQVEV